MYIPEFWCGFVLGMVIGVIVLIAISCTCSSKDNKKGE
jgi:hypothetical protein